MTDTPESNQRGYKYVGLTLILLSALSVITILVAIILQVGNNSQSKRIAYRFAEVADNARRSGATLNLTNQPGQTNEERAINLLKKGVRGSGEFSDKLYKVTIELSPKDIRHVADHLKWERGEIAFVEK